LITCDFLKILGKDVQLEVNTDVNTDVDVTLNLNELALTDGLVRYIV